MGCARVLADWHGVLLVPDGGPHPPRTDRRGDRQDRHNLPRLARGYRAGLVPAQNGNDQPHLRPPQGLPPTLRIFWDFAGRLPWNKSASTNTFPPLVATWAPRRKPTTASHSKRRCNGWSRNCSREARRRHPCQPQGAGLWRIIFAALNMDPLVAL